MNQYSLSEQHNKTPGRIQKNASASALGLSLMGVLFLFSGILWFSLTAIEAYRSNETQNTIVSVFIGLGLYRFGKFLLQQVGKYKLRPNRRRQVIS